jgi:AcrR family transcriptional regulator
MGRRSDHSREELETLILAAGQELMAEGGFAHFSARELAKRIGYSVGTVASFFGSVDGLVVAINSRTFLDWAEYVEQRLANLPGSARIVTLVEAYFDFARDNHNLWAAIYEHRLPQDMAMPPRLASARKRLTGIVVREVEAVLPPSERPGAVPLAHSFIALVHGHCTFALNGSFALLGETDPLGLATARVREALQARGAVI